MAESVEAFKVRLINFCDAVATDRGVIANNENVAVAIKQVLARLKTLLELVV